MSKVSIIIPVYNTAEYLNDTLDSVLNQTHKDIQVLLIDDGSTDGSGSICDNYAERDDRIKVFHKENGGVSAARNTGLEYAEGEYLAFFDSDDIVLPNMLEDLLQVAKKYSIDIVQSGNFIDGKKDTNEVTTYTKGHALDELFLMTNKVKPSMCLGIYKRNVFIDVTFPPHIHFYEDFAVQCHVIAKSNGVAVLDNRYYKYIDRIGSATRSGLNEKKWSMAVIPEYLRNQNVCRDSQDYRSLICSFHAGKLFYSIILRDVTKADVVRYRKMLTKNIFYVLCAHKVKFRKRLIPFFYLILPDLTKRILRKMIND